MMNFSHFGTAVVVTTESLKSITISKNDQKTGSRTTTESAWTTGRPHRQEFTLWRMRRLRSIRKGAFHAQCEKLSYTIKHNRSFLVQTLTQITLKDLAQAVVNRNAEAEGHISLVKHQIATGQPIVFSDREVRIRKLECWKGKAIFILEVSDIEVSLCYGCWDASLCDDFWEEVEQALRNTTGVEARLDAPPPVPWLAFLTGTAYDELPAEKTAFVNSAAPYVVWAVMDLDLKKEPPNGNKGTRA